MYRKEAPGKSPESRLAQAKLLVMFTTLTGRAWGISNAGKKQVLALQARSWFFGDSDFEWWCEAAGYDPRVVRGKARRIVDGDSGLKPGAYANWWTPEELDFLFEEKAKATSIEEIAVLLGRSVKSVNAMYYLKRKEQGAALAAPDLANLAPGKVGDAR